MDDIMQRIAKIEGRIFAQNAVLALLVGETLGRTHRELEPSRAIVLDAIERRYKTHRVTDLGHLALQTAIDLAEELLSGKTTPRQDGR